MKRQLRNVTLGVLLTTASCITTFAQQVVDLSTGISIWGPIGLVGLDDDWKVQLPDGSITTPRVCANLDAWATSNCSQWLTTAFGGDNKPGKTTEGNYTYTLKFQISERCQASSASLNITRIGADNNITSFLINGHSYPVAPSTSHDFNPLGGPYNLVVNTAHLVSGTNTVTVTVNNAEFYTGFNLCGKITINFTGGNLAPSITGNNMFCGGTAPTFVGSDGPGGTADDYLWEAVECNSAGVPVPGAPNVYSMWFIGAPGNITMPANAFACNKYYRIRLVATNSCTQWSEGSKVIYINCPSAANAGPDVSVCPGACVTIGTTGSAKTQYNWSFISGGLPTGAGNTPQITVCPTQTTVYTLTSSNITGCTSTDQVTVTVLPNDPTFSLFTNTSNPAYFTLTATPNDVTGLSQPGFFFHWVIEEMNGGTAYYYNAYSNCWWTYPAQNFIGYVSTGTGTYTQTANCPPPITGPVGRFLYNHTYRITLATWNDNCPWRQSSITVTPVKNLNGGNPSMVMFEDHSTPDFSFLQTGGSAGTPQPVADTDPMLSIYPNPSTGLFTVSVNTPAEGMLEVIDVLGKKVHSLRLNAGTATYTLDLGSFAKGIYMLNISAGNLKETRKVVLE